MGEKTDKKLRNPPLASRTEERDNQTCFDSKSVAKTHLLRSILFQGSRNNHEDSELDRVCFRESCLTVCIASLCQVCLEGWTELYDSLVLIRSAYSSDACAPVSSHKVIRDLRISREYNKPQKVMEKVSKVLQLATATESQEAASNMMRAPEDILKATACMLVVHKNAAAVALSLSDWAPLTKDVTGHGACCRNVHGADEATGPSFKILEVACWQTQKVGYLEMPEECNCIGSLNLVSKSLVGSDIFFWQDRVPFRC